MNPDVFDSRIRTPCTILIIGKSNCGKSETIFNIIDRRVEIFDKPIENMFYVYKSYQSKFDALKLKHPEIVFLTDQKDIPETNGELTLIVYDDKMQDFSAIPSETAYINDIFIRRSHHENIIAIVTLQSIFAKNLRSIATNATYHIIFPNPRDTSGIDHLNTQMFPSSRCFLREVMKDVSLLPYSFVLLDNHSSTHPNFRVRNFLYPIRSANIYIPKDDSNNRERGFFKKVAKSEGVRKEKVNR